MPNTINDNAILKVDRYSSGYPVAGSVTITSLTVTDANCYGE